MTDKEIIKAIEHCKNNEGNGCRGCVFYGNEKGTCIDELLTDAFDLINRQQAEIERLKSDLHDCVREVSKSHKIDRINAIKEYNEKLKEHAYLDSGITGFQEMVVDLSDIENIADEMVGEDK